MPLNSTPPTTTLENLKVKQNEARRVGVHCDVGFWGGIVPGNAAELVPMLEAGVKGFKCFLIDSGVEVRPELLMLAHTDQVLGVLTCGGGRPDQGLRRFSSKSVVFVGTMTVTKLAQNTSALILFHAELEGPDDIPSTNVDPSQYSAFLESRPSSMELSALDLVLRLVRGYPRLRFHIVHLSTAAALPAIRQARASGISNLTVETCFHYLCLRSEDIALNATQYKCCPPIRDEANRKQLCAALLDGTIDFVVSDHSPCLPELKKGDFMSAWGGVSGLGLGLSLLWTELGAQAGLGSIIRWLGCRPAGPVELQGTKGVIAVGADADFALFDPTAQLRVTEVGGFRTRW